MKNHIAVSILVVFSAVGLIACGGDDKDKKPACEQTTGPCGPREELLVLKTQVEDGVVLTPNGMKEQATSAASVVVANEKAKLAEESYREKLAQIKALEARLQERVAEKVDTRDPCANLRGRVREVCAGL